jgi:hypothetical protein
MSAGGLRASDADRDRVAEVLHTAYAEGRIDADEHEERIQATFQAKTFDDLMPLTADLIPNPTDRLGGVPPAAVVTNETLDEPDRMTAALSEVKRQGKWRVRPRSYTNVFLGSVHLDMTEATFVAPVVEVNVTQLLGSVELRVPTGTTIRDETATVLAETSIKGIGEPDPSIPTIVLRGTNVLGEIRVRGPKKLSVWRRALA